MKLSGIMEYLGKVGSLAKNRRGFLAGSGLNLIIIVSCCCASRTQAAISTLTETVSLAPQYAGFSSVPVSFQKFDSSLGRLSSVEIILQGTGEFTQRYENTSGRSDAARMRQSITLTLTLPDANKPFLKASQVEKHRYSVGPFDGAIDFAGPSGVTADYEVTAENDKVLSSRKNLALFTGSGFADIFLSTRAAYHISGIGQSSAFEVQALTGADISVIYNYIAVPEPAWSGLLAGGAALVMARMTRPAISRRDIETNSEPG
jgi:hypothetical protein